MCENRRIGSPFLVHASSAPPGSVNARPCEIMLHNTQASETDQVNTFVKIICIEML